MTSHDEMITSAANPRIRAALELRERRGRDRTGRLVIDGTREVARALEGGLTVVEAFVDAGAPRDDEAARVADRLSGLGVAIVRVDGAARRRLAYGDRASGIVAVALAPTTALGGVEAVVAATRAPLVVVVEDPEKPGNLGAIARSADGAGATALVVAVNRGPAADPWHANAIRSSLGTIFVLPIAVAPSGEVLAWLRAAGLRIVAARVQATVRYDAVDLRSGTAIAVGSEADGLGSAWLALDVTGVCLPMRGRADSLNVSAAAAVLLYEARRQRDADTEPPSR